MGQKRKTNITYMTKPAKKKTVKRAKTFERKRVIVLLDELLQHPDMLIDAVTNEYTNWDAESLLEFAEECKTK